MILLEGLFYEGNIWIENAVLSIILGSIAYIVSKVIKIDDLPPTKRNKKIEALVVLGAIAVCALLWVLWRLYIRPLIIAG